MRIRKVTYKQQRQSSASYRRATLEIDSDGSGVSGPGDGESSTDGDAGIITVGECEIIAATKQGKAAIAPLVIIEATKEIIIRLNFMMKVSGGWSRLGKVNELDTLSI